MWETIAYRIRLAFKISIGIAATIVVAFICFAVFFPVQYEQYQQYALVQDADREAQERQRIKLEQQQALEARTTRSVQLAYEGLDMKWGNFDVGGHCLNE